MSRLIPPIDTKGRYTLKLPFVAQVNILYSCASIREFIDLENQGIDVYTTYYQPHGLDVTDYQQDRTNNEAIITLVSDTLAPIYVPSSYILTYPDLSYHNYQHVVLSASLGPLPDSIDLTFVRNQMATVISDVVGVMPEVHVSVVGLDGVITPAQHESLEAAREAAITNRTTDRARLLQEQQKVAELETKIRALEELLFP